jgi:signal transduction histidine kinase
MNILFGFTAILLYLTIDNLFHGLERSRCLYRQAQLELAQRIQAEHALQQAKADAEFANLAKTNFLCSVSHELRTPLNHILGFAQLLEMQCAGILSEKHMSHIRTILKSGNHLFALIKDVLDLSHMDLGTLNLDRTSIPLKPLLEHTMAIIREKDFKPHLAIHLYWPETLQDIEVLADPRYLKQIMFNLLSNAVKFTPDGGTVTIEVEQQEQETWISITDTGIGIATDQQEKIFENFYQVDDGSTGKATGIGLGLPIVRRLVELHGGTLRVHSNGEGQGSCFRVSLPRISNSLDIINTQQHKVREVF